MTMPQMQKAIAKLRFLLASIKGKEEELEGLSRQFRRPARDGSEPSAPGRRFPRLDAQRARGDSGAAGQRRKDSAPPRLHQVSRSRGAARARPHSQDRAGKDGARDPQSVGRRTGRRHRRPQEGSGTREVHRRRQYPGGRGDYGRGRRGRTHAVEALSPRGAWSPEASTAGDADSNRPARRRRDPEGWRTAR